MGTMTITEFLTARLDEVQALAELQPPWPWRVGDDPTEVTAEDGIEVATAFALSGNQQRNVAAHIARHDPAHVLAEVKAKRALLAQAAEMREVASATEAWSLNDYADGIERNLAAPHADHPDYNPAWRVE